MANGFETIGWVLSVKDKATTQVAKITKVVDSAVAKTAVAAKGMATVLGEELVDSVSDLMVPIKAVGKAFKSVFGSAAQEALDGVLNTAGKIGDVLGGAWTRTVHGAVSTWHSVVDILTKERTWAESIETATKIITGPFRAGMKSVVFLARGATLAVTNLMQRFISIEKITKGIDRMGGIGGVLLGPLGPLMKLFSPLIDMFVGQFTPAIETFAAIVETAFGPFSMTLEIIARNLAIKLVPFIGKFASLAEVLAVQFGVWVTKLIEGPNGGLMGTLMKFMPALLAIVLKLAPVLMDVGVRILEKIIVPALLKAANFVDTHMPQIIEFIDDLGVGLVKAVDWVSKLEVGVFIDAVVIGFGKLKAIIIGVQPHVKLFVDSFLIGLKKLMKPIEEITRRFKVLGDVGGLLAGEGTFSSKMSALGVPGFADGAAMVKGPRGVGVPGVIGEAGPEMVLPLRADVVERVLAPLLPDFKSKALDRMVVLMAEQNRYLRGTLRVVMEGGGSARDDGGSALDSSPGMYGGGGW